MSNSQSVKAVKSLRLAISAALIGSHSEAQTAARTAGRLAAEAGWSRSDLRAALDPRNRLDLLR